MKAKCIIRPSWPQFSNPDSIYDVIQSPRDSECYDVYLNGEYLEGWPKSRFQIIEETLEEQLQSAKNKVAEIEAQIEAQIEIQIEIQKPKIGQKYRHQTGSIWMIVRVSRRFALICIEDNRTACTGQAYGTLHSNINDVFDEFKHNFTLLP